MRIQVTLALARYDAKERVWYRTGEIKRVVHSVREGLAWAERQSIVGSVGSWTAVAKRNRLANRIFVDLPGGSARQMGWLRTGWADGDQPGDARWRCQEWLTFEGVEALAVGPKDVVGAPDGTRAA